MHSNSRFPSRDIKADFPIFQKKQAKKPLVYLDNAATSQKPQQVISAITEVYSGHYANIHRGVYHLSEDISAQYEKARQKVAKFIHAKNPESIVFTRNTTESINLVASSWGEQNIHKGDIIVTSELEHHSNLLPWQRLAKKQGASLAFLPVDKDFQLTLKTVERYLNTKIKLVALTGMSNVTGTCPPLKKIAQRVHEIGAKLLVDGAQLIPHRGINVTLQDVDFLAFSGHKMLAPTGIGVLYAKPDILNAMPPYQLGGGMIQTATLDGAEFANTPTRFEAGTPNIVGAIGLSYAIDYLEQIGMDLIKNHEEKLTEYALKSLKNIKGLQLIGPSETKNRGGVFSFVLGSIHPHDLATILDSDFNIAIRAGHHCAMPFHKKLGLLATSRASIYLYNTKDDINRLCEAIVYAKKVLER